jgi:TPR repeat protein
MLNKKTLIGLALLVAPAAVGCGAGAAAEAARPDAPTANKAFDEASCHEIEKGGEPLIVDWKTEQRGDLEVAMKTGIAVVSYSCKGIKVLPECKLDGEYGFIGMTRREQVVRLKGADEMKANLPLSGGAIGGELQRGSTLDIAMMLVGKKRTTKDGVTKEDLQGTCDGATHFVRGAMVGAFAMSAGSEAKVRAAAEIFGVGASGGSESSKQAENRDGDVTDCKTASPDSDKAPGQCGAPVRLVLAPIVTKAPAGAPPAEPAQAKKGVEEVEKTDCPKGLVFAEGKCAKADAAPYECDPANADECKAQCDKGNAASCGILGGKLADKNDYAGATAPLKKGCDGGHARSCANLGIMMTKGLGMKADVAGAIPLFEKSCQAADGVGCRELGRNYLLGNAPATKDEARAAKLFKQACDGGDDDACGLLAGQLEEGKGVTKDRNQAGKLYKRACDGGQIASCAKAGKFMASGPTKNEILAEMAFRRGCIRMDAASCQGLARLQLAKSPDEAKRNFQLACNQRDQLACAASKVLFGGNAVVIPSPQLTNELGASCRSDMGGYDCVSLGLLDVARGQGPAAKMNLQTGCSRGDKFACELMKKAP